MCSSTFSLENVANHLFCMQVYRIVQLIYGCLLAKADKLWTKRLYYILYIILIFYYN